MLHVIIAVRFTEERIGKLEKELENANDLLAAARQRGNKNAFTSNLFFFSKCPVSNLYF